MARSSKNKSLIKRPKELIEAEKMGGEREGGKASEKLDIEQTRMEYRREADLDDKTPAGDGGPEDEGRQRELNDEIPY
jgi:hypothetical protein